MKQRESMFFVTVLIISVFGSQFCFCKVEGRPRRILLDTDVDTDDFFALLYLLKLDRSEFELEAMTISANAWGDVGHSVHQIYDILYMMDRDDVALGVGGEGGILEDGSILPNVGGYLPIIDQGVSTVGGCRYRQAIPLGLGGRLETDTNFGIRKAFLPQGSRKYSPLEQPTAQQVMIDKISAGPITLILIGSHTNFAIFLMNNPHLKKNVEEIYIMGGAVEPRNSSAKNDAKACNGSLCDCVGNLFTEFSSNPYAEFNIFADPFAAYQVFHSGIPITLVPLDATDSIPTSKNFFMAFEQRQNTYEAQYCFQSLKMARDTRFDAHFYSNYFMWDSFTMGVAVSIMRNSRNQDGKNEFAEMEYMNLTVVTSNEPYGIPDGSNPLFDGLKVPKFGLKKGSLHSGHVQTGLEDPFCFVKGGIGKCKDGYTAKATGPDAVCVLVATKAKPSRGALDKAFYKSFLDVLNLPQHSGRFNFTTEFPYYKEVYYKPDFKTKKLGKPVIFDMDMSAGDFLALFYLLKVPVEVLDLKAVIVSPSGWAHAATIDVVYDLLHMMGRDDIPVVLGDIFAINQTDRYSSLVGDCKYSKAIPHGSGGFLDADTLFGLARNLPRSPRRYTAENSIEFGAPRNTSHPELRQPLALEFWNSLVKTLDPGSKITILTNGPLTTLAQIVLTDANATSHIQEVFIVGGHIRHWSNHEGNVFTIPSNRYAEFNMFLDPLAAKTVLTSGLNITLIPLSTQRKINSFLEIQMRLKLAKETPEAQFAKRLVSSLYSLQQTHRSYQHMDIFLGEILGAVLLGSEHSSLNPTFQEMKIRVIAKGDESVDGQILADKMHGKSVRVLENVNHVAYYDLFANQLRVKDQSAVIASFDEQKRIWSRPPNETANSSIKHFEMVNL